MIAGKKLTISFLLISATGLAVGYALSKYATGFRNCTGNDLMSCDVPFGNLIGEPLFIVSLALFFVFLSLHFLRPIFLKTWLKFGIWYMPLAVVVILVTPHRCQDFFCMIDRLFVAQVLGIVFVLISVLIIGFKYWRLRKGQ